MRAAEPRLSTRGRQLPRCLLSFLEPPNVMGGLPGKRFKVAFASSLSPPNTLLISTEYIAYSVRLGGC